MHLTRTTSSQNFAGSTYLVLDDLGHMVSCLSFLIGGGRQSPPSQVWPPVKGETFETSVLCWSFSGSAFWRGKEGISMAEVMGIARVIAASRFREAGAKPNLLLVTAYVLYKGIRFRSHKFEQKAWEVGGGRSYGEELRVGAWRGIGQMVSLARDSLWAFGEDL